MSFLRSLRLSDEEAVYSFLSDERVIRYMLFPRFDRTRAGTFTARFQSSDPTGSPLQTVFAIAPADAEQVVGLCGLLLDASQLQGEVWYLLDPRLWGRGLVTLFDGTGAPARSGMVSIDPIERYRSGPRRW